MLDERALFYIGVHHAVPYQMPGLHLKIPMYDIFSPLRICLVHGQLDDTRWIVECSCRNPNGWFKITFRSDLILWNRKFSSNVKITGRYLYVCMRIHRFIFCQVSVSGWIQQFLGDRVSHKTALNRYINIMTPFFGSSLSIFGVIWSTPCDLLFLL